MWLLLKDVSWFLNFRIFCEFETVSKTRGPFRKTWHDVGPFSCCVSSVCALFLPSYHKILNTRQHIWRHNCQKPWEEKHFIKRSSFSKALSFSLSHTHTHKHIDTNTYTSKQRCHFTQEGSAVLSIRQGLVLGQRLLPNLRPPSPGSTAPPLRPPPPRRQAPHCSRTTNKWQFSCSDKL